MIEAQSEKEQLLRFVDNSSVIETGEDPKTQVTVTETVEDPKTQLTVIETAEDPRTQIMLSLMCER